MSTQHTPWQPPSADEYAEIQRRIAIARGVLHDYGGTRCMCVQTGCRAGPGCPHYCSGCRSHIDAIAKARSAA